MRSPDISLKQLAAFVAVVDAGGFTAASEGLYVSQSVVSRTIAALERSVGGALFNRDSRQLRTTPLGDDLLQAARRVLSAHADAMWEVDQFAAGRRGTVRLAAMPSVAQVLLPPVTARFRRDRPDVAVRLLEGPATKVHQYLSDRVVEIGLTWKQDSVAIPAGMQVAPLVIDRLVAVVHKKHRLASRDQIRWAELSEHPMVSLAADASSRRLTDRTLESIGAPKVPVIEVGSAATVAAMVTARLGVAAMSAMVTGLLGDSVTTIPLCEPEVTRTVCLFWTDDEMSAASRHFVEEMQRVRTATVTLPAYVDWA